MKIKEILNSIWNEFIYGGHLLSLGAVSVVFTSAILLNIKITWDCLLVVYLGTQSVYLYNRFKEFDKDFLTNPERTRYIKKYVRYIPLIVFLFSFTAVAIVLYFNKTLALIFGFLILSLGLFYSLFFKKLTRKIIAFKSFFVSLIWVLLIIFLALYYSLSLSLGLFLVFTFVFLRFIISTSFFDFKDIETDKKEGLLTLPIVFGKEKLIKILNIINILAVMPIISGFYLNLFPKSSIMLLLTIPYTFYYFKKLEDKNINTTFLNYVIVDGEFVLWSIFILIGKFLL